jgi:hypothetical protein
MDWLRTNYDRAAALVAALFLVLSALFILLGASGLSERFSILQNGPPPNRTIPAGQGPEITKAMERLRAPTQWTAAGRSGLFVPEKHFIGADGQPATLRNVLLHPPVPNDWLEDFGLPATEADVLDQDPDSDGFTNLDEWNARSNPVDKESHPPYTFKLRLRSYTREIFSLIFSSSIGDTYAINNIDRSRPTQFLHLGQTVGGTNYKLTKYTEKSDTDKYGTTIDISELTLEQADTHDIVVLVKEKRATAPESVANFVYDWGGSKVSFAVKRDQHFSLKPREENKYKLLDVQPDKAIIIDSQNPNEKIEIGPAKP